MNRTEWYASYRDARLNPEAAQGETLVALMRNEDTLSAAKRMRLRYTFCGTLDDAKRMAHRFVTSGFSRAYANSFDTDDRYERNVRRFYGRSLCGRTLVSGHYPRPHKRA